MNTLINSFSPHTTVRSKKSSKSPIKLNFNNDNTSTKKLSLNKRRLKSPKNSSIRLNNIISDFIQSKQNVKNTKENFSIRSKRKILSPIFRIRKQSNNKRKYGFNSPSPHTTINLEINAKYNQTNIFL